MPFFDAMSPIVVFPSSESKSGSSEAGSFAHGRSPNSVLVFPIIDCVDASNSCWRSDDFHLMSGETMLANQLALSIMKQGKNSNGKPRNTKFVLDLSAAKPIAAIKAETNESGIREWHECDGVFDSSLCGERSPSEKLQACREQIQTAMSISPDKIRPVRNTRRKAHRYKNEGGTITVGVDSYTKTDGTHVTGYWRTVSSVL